MSEKARDRQGRWRSKTIAFRISPEENEELNKLVAMSGLTKQEYIMCRLAGRDVVVIGNPRVHKALKRQMEQLTQEFGRLTDAAELTPEMVAVLEYLTRIYDGMKTEGTKQCPTVK